MTINVLTKELAGQEDMMFGTGSVNQTRNGNTTPIDKIAIIKPLATLAELQALLVTDPNKYYPYAKTYGGATLGDGSGNDWWFDVTEPISSDNGTTIIAGNGATVGCWKIP